MLAVTESGGGKAGVGGKIVRFSLAMLNVSRWRLLGGDSLDRQAGMRSELRDCLRAKRGRCMSQQDTGDSLNLCEQLKSPKGGD